MSDGRHGNTAAFRGENQLYFFVSPVSDQGRGRFSEMRYPGRTQLLRNGELIGESDWATSGEFVVGPERAVYTLRSSVDRSVQAGLSTRIDAEWTFASQRSPRPLEQTTLPLLGVRFAPDLDNHNAAPAGCRFTFPVSVQRNGSDRPGAVTTPAVEVSFDDGGTWQPVSTGQIGDQWTATVDHPAGARFVSLRSSVSDADGNAQRQTIIRAYALK